VGMKLNACVRTDAGGPGAPPRHGNFVYAGGRGLVSKRALTNAYHTFAGVLERSRCAPARPRRRNMKTSGRERM